MCENLESILCFVSTAAPFTPAFYNLFDLSFFYTQTVKWNCSKSLPLLLFRVWYGFNSVDNGSHRLTITPEQATFRLASGLSLPSKSALSDRRANWSCSYMSMDFSPWGMAFLCWERARDAETEIYAGRKHCGSPRNWIQSPSLAGHNGNALHCHPLPPHFPSVSVSGWPHEGGKVLYPW